MALGSAFLPVVWSSGLRGIGCGPGVQIRRNAELADCRGTALLRSHETLNGRCNTSSHGSRCADRSIAAPCSAAAAMKHLTRCSRRLGP